MKNLGITHAISSPRGEVGFLLASSDHWSIISEYEGSRIWQFQEIPTDESTREIMIFGIEEILCQLGCDWRISPWTGLYEWSTSPVPENRSFLSDGSISMDVETSRGMRSSMVRVSALIEAPPDQTVSITASSAGNSSTIQRNTDGSVQMITTLVNVGDNGLVTIGINADTDNKNWINPTALSATQPVVSPSRFA